MFASLPLALEPTAIIAWVFVGLVVSTFAAHMGKGRGYRIILDTAAALIGALAGGFLILLLAGGTAGFWEGILAAVAVACVLIAVLRVVAPTGGRS